MHILESFAGLMRQQNYDEISITQIAAQAEVGKGTVLAHFSEKLSLAATMFAQQLAECTKRTEAVSVFSQQRSCGRSLTPSLAWSCATTFMFV